MLRFMVGGFDRAAALIACLLVVALLGCVALGVITRGLGDPFIWTDELSRFLMVWLAVFGWILASRKRIHVRIRYVQDLLPVRVHTAVEVLFQIALTLLGVLIAWYGAGLVAKNLDLEATSLPIAMAWMYMPMVLAGVVTAVQAACEVFEALTRSRASGAGSAAGLP
jgi:TRAP-type C4-dicarboxylate transport system permease small subunit